MITIYGLFDPRDNTLRYIGKTKDALSVRLERHVRKSHLRATTRKNSWLKSLGTLPRIEALEFVSDEEADDIERFWIASIRSVGGLLVNGTDGGDGGPIYSETRAKRLKEYHVKRRADGRPHPGPTFRSEETRAKMRSHKKSDEHKRKISDSVRKTVEAKRNKFASPTTEVE